MSYLKIAIIALCFLVAVGLIVSGFLVLVVVGISDQPGGFGLGRGRALLLAGGAMLVVSLIVAVVLTRERRPGGPRR